MNIEGSEKWQRPRGPPNSNGIASDGSSEYGRVGEYQSLSLIISRGQV